jgi:copper chaperone
MRIAALRYMGMNQSTQPVAGGIWATTVKIEGMTCGACVRHLARVLEALPGVVHVAVDLGRKEGRVGHLARWAGDSALIEAIADAGYAANLATNPTPEIEQPRRASATGATACCCG